LNAATAALLGASIAGTVALASSVLTNLVTLRNERFKQMEARRATYVEALRKQTGVAFAELFGLQHADNWISWFAEHDPSAIKEAMITAHRAEIHAAYQKLLGAMAMLAALNLRVYEELLPLARRVYSLDHQVGLALRHFSEDQREDQEAGVRSLRHCFREALQLEHELPPELARIMKVADSESPG
jgi:hypothetical protein